MKNRIDAFGKSINIGDYVVYSGTRVGLYVSKIKKFSPIMIHLETGGKYYSNELMIISKNEEDQYYKRKKGPL